MRPQLDRFDNYNGHKRSVVLDLKVDHDRRRLFEFVTQAEVVVEGYRPGIADRLGVGFDALRTVNPSIVVCSITGFGQTCPLAAVPGHDHNFQAYAGAFTFPTGRQPEHAGLLVGDQGSGTAAAFAIVAAVLCARRTGEAEHIDVAIADLLAAWVAPLGSLYAEDDTAPSQADLPGLGTFRTADGEYVELGVYSENHLWDALCRSLGLEHLVAVDMAGRAARAAEVRSEVAAAIAGHLRDPLVDRLTEQGVPIAPILSRTQMLEHPNFRARGVITTGPTGRPAIGHPIHYAAHPARPPGRPPTLDEHGKVGFGAV